ncbi:MAG TPA: hypothetical protein VMY42_20670 [Thermoguttaceae bacterium]|nr:hypothetical protein [Thermoguttaceae bacterium]
MPTGTISQTVTIAGVSMTGSSSRTESGHEAHDPELPAGKAGTLSTRTSATVGVATLSAGHGITTDDYVDVYWTGGVRYGMDVTAVDGNAVSIDGTTAGGGDDLPALDSDIIVTPRVTIDADFNGVLAEMIAALCTRRGHLEFLDDDDASLATVELQAGEPWSWAKGVGFANPFTGNPVGSIEATCGEVTAGKLLVGILFAST